MAADTSNFPPLSIGWLLDLYTATETPHKGESKRAQDARGRRVFIDYFRWRAEEHGEAERGPQRAVVTLDALDWKGFVRARSEGLIPGWPTRCRDNQVSLDLKFLIAVLNWAHGAEPHEPQYIALNPWRVERRRAARMRLPREKDPRQPGMSDAEFRRLLVHSPDWRFSLTAILCRETLHRMSSVRQIRRDPAELDLQREVISWSRQTDKNRRGLVTVLSADAVEAIRSAPVVPGSPYLIPSVKDPMRPVSRSTLETWMRRAKQEAGIRGEGVAFHSLRRSGVRCEPFRELPPLVQEEMTGTSYAMLRSTYDRVPLRTLRQATLAVASTERLE